MYSPIRSVNTVLRAAPSSGSRVLQAGVRRAVHTTARVASKCQASSSGSGKQRTSLRPSLKSRCITSQCARHFPATPLQRSSYSTVAPAVGEPIIHDIFEPVTGTWQYVVADPSSKSAVIIDAVLDFEPVTRVISTRSADALSDLVKEKGYTVDMILETHAHADHLTAASYLQKKLANEQEFTPSVGIGKRIGGVQKFFGGRYGVSGEEYGVVFDKLFDDDETFKLGDLDVTVMHLPGHTPDHIGYKVGDNVFCGDSIFQPDIGTARCDFPGGSANTLFQSTHKLLELPDSVKIWVGHDYPPEGRSAESWMSVKDHKIQNRHLKEGVTEGEFVTMREERDAGLAEPRLLHQSLQINIRGGRLPKPTEAGQQMLHTPLKTGKLQF